MSHESGEASSEGAQHWLPASFPSRLPIEDLRARIRRRFAVLDTAENAIVMERSELAMAWNRTLSVNRLPNELLVTIFAEVAYALWASESRSPVNRLYPSSQWMKLIIVCRYWRDVAYASPKLWRVIHVRSPAHTGRALALTSTATIDVLFGKYESHATNFQLLQPHAPRIRFLYLQVVDVVWKSSVVALLQGDGGMLALEILYLPFSWKPAGHHEPTDKDFADLRLTSERYPHLRSLTLAFAVAPQDIKVYARLRKLSLRDCRCDFSFDHFLDVLEASTNLEILVLNSFLERIQGDWAESALARESPVSLRHLKSLEVTNHPPAHTSRFLSQILLSSTTPVSISSSVEVALGEDLTETIPSMLPSNIATALPALALVKAVAVEAYMLQYRLCCSLEPLAQGKDLVSLRLQSNVHWTDLSANAGRDLLRVFASAPLTSLTFAGHCADVGLEGWTEIFTTWPLLETLKLTQADTGTECVFAGLMHAAPPPDSPVPCPSLQFVSIGGLFFEEAVDVLLQCLRARAEKGHRLRRIWMGLTGEADEEALMDTHYMPALRELVPDATCAFRT
ncbi:hypothetical protein GSI_09097 [Ganoderma sinense ZZ0214-1]|uniref:F-box domain-containing protein n=1 Tax=Ganoderma sinense ZZ0214-1 TaxID=1077348 RepID=A0A2G8S5J1_9APHY|nr:hypothetical protein GSI_09097 [Ganoderma sinense ZZ0214-1]